ncbi:hypothetical protein ACFL5Y_03630 [Candidatus Omnitrophota bacterium]
MKFECLNKDLTPLAEILIKHFRKNGYNKIICEKPLHEDDLIRPTLICKKRGSTIVIEIKETPSFPDYFEEFVKNCLLNRDRIELYLAVPFLIDEAEITYPHNFLDKIKKYGVGVFVVKDKIIIERDKAIICHMRITKADVEVMGGNKKRILPMVEKFNKGQFIDAIRDLTEFYEEIITTLAKKAARARKIVPTISDIESSAYDFEKIINVLSCPFWNDKNKKRKKQKKRYFDSRLNLDVKAYKGTRNLSHHPRTKAEERKLEDECFTRMHTGMMLIRTISKMKA